MPRTLKTYVTSLGFFDLAVAAPSMKAALDAWGSGRNLFHQGFAQETDDPKIVEDTMEKPGVVLKRPVGTHDAFTEEADLPKSLPVDRPKARPAPKPKPKGTKTKKGKATAKVISLAEAKAARQAAAAFEKERERREREDRKEEAARQKEHERREGAVAKAKAALETAEGHHDNAAQKIEDERAALDERADAEQARWNKQKSKLEADLERARE